MPSSSNSATLNDELLVTHASEAAAIQAVMVLLRRKMTQADAVGFVTFVALSSQSDRNATPRANPTRPSSYGSTPSPSPSRKPKRRSTAREEAQRLRSAAYHERKASGFRKKAPQAAPESDPPAAAMVNVPPLATDLVVNDGGAGVPLETTASTNVDLEHALELSEREFASPPRGVHRAAPLVITLDSASLLLSASAAPFVPAAGIDEAVEALPTLSVESQDAVLVAFDEGSSVFASPPRGLPSASTRIDTPSRMAFSDSTQRRRREALAKSPKTPSANLLAFITQHMGPGEAPPRMLELLMGELEQLPESKWPEHLAAAGGSYIPRQILSPFRMPGVMSVGKRRTPSQRKRLMSP